MAENATVTNGLNPRMITQRIHTTAVTIASTGEFVIGVAPEAATLHAARYIPDGNATGDATNYRTFAIIDKTSTDTMASLAQTANDAAHNLVAFTAKTLTNSATATNLNVAAGDVITFKSTPTGSGLADPGGTVEIDLSRATG